MLNTLRSLQVDPGHSEFCLQLLPALVPPKQMRRKVEEGRPLNLAICGLRMGRQGHFEKRASDGQYR